MAKTKQLEIKQVRSVIGRPEKHRRTLLALGLKKNQTSVIQNDTPQIRGMIQQVSHLLDVRTVE